MCCLKYEQEVYEDKLKRLPKIGAIVKTVDGEGEVCGIETLAEKVKVKLKDGDEFFYKKYDSKDVKVIKEGKGLDDEYSKEELAELKKLEKLGQMDTSNEDI